MQNWGGNSRKARTATTQDTVGAKREGRRQNLDQTFRGVRGHDPPGHVLYLGLLNWLEMHLKVPHTMKFINL